jgi:Peptidase A4 family
MALVPGDRVMPVSCAVSPSGFDVTMADKAELAKYRIPSRPDPRRDERGYTIWNSVFTKDLRVIEPEFVVSDMVHGPIQVSDDATSEAMNWSGLTIVPNVPSVFTQVTGYWECVPVSEGQAGADSWYCASWIGIDGAGSPDCLQAGITEIVNAPHDTTSYFAWHEWVPGPSLTWANVPVGPGERVYCQITATSTTDAHVLCVVGPISVAFVWKAPAGTALVGNVAEWIVERPTVNGSLSMLADYNAITFSAMAARDDNATIYDTSQIGTLWSMTEDNRTISTPDIVSSNEIVVSYIH